MAKITPMVNPTDDNLVTSPSTEKVSEWTDLAKVLDELSKIRKDNDEMRKQIETLRSTDPAEAIKARKEIYKWPHKYGFKIYEGSPVVGFKTVRMESIKNSNSGIVVVIHDIEVSTLDEKKHRVEYEVFGQRYVHSEKYFVEQVTERAGKKYYTFDTPEFGKFELEENLIN